VSVAIWHGGKGAHLLPKCSTTHPPATRPLNPRSSRLKMRWNLLARVVCGCLRPAPPRAFGTERLLQLQRQQQQQLPRWLAVPAAAALACMKNLWTDRTAPVPNTGGDRVVTFMPRPACPCQPRRTGGADAAAALVRGEFRERANPPKTRAESSASS
jgi:hypothetical protein